MANLISLTDLQGLAVDGEAARCVEELHEGEVRIARAVVPLQRTAWRQEDNTANAAKFKAQHLKRPEGRRKVV